MKQKRHTTEEIIRILREADSGKAIDAVCRAHNIAPAIVIRQSSLRSGYCSSTNKSRVCPASTPVWATVNWLAFCAVKAGKLDANLSNASGGSVVIEDYRRYYNEVRPHGGIGYRTPAQACIEAQAFDTKVASPQPPELDPNPETVTRTT